MFPLTSETPRLESEACRYLPAILRVQTSREPHDVPATSSRQCEARIRRIPKLLFPVKQKEKKVHLTRSARGAG